MILSVSRRTDIPAFYGQWFMERIKSGFVYVRSVFDAHRVYSVSLSSDAIECIVFWTKNPAQEFIKSLPALDEAGYKYYFQYSITPYGSDVERCVGSKAGQIEKFRMLSDALGADRVIWRYDPIFINGHYNMDYHAKWAEYIASSLCGKTHKCVISFIDRYKHISRRLDEAGIKEMTIAQMEEAGKRLSAISAKYGISMETCSEETDLSKYLIKRGKCIDGQLINSICGKEYIFHKDRGQRPSCGCVASVDIGAYNTCRNGCVYCYATYGFSAPDKANEMQSPLPANGNNSPLLCSRLGKDDILTERIIKANKVAEREFPY